MSNSTKRGSARLRTALFTSAAIASMVVAGAAHAQSAGPLDPNAAVLEAQGDRTSVAGAPTGDYIESQGNNVVKVDPEPEIVIANPQTPVTDRDPVNVTGIGQMVVDQGGGFIGLCTGTLINPRTVIFAAHCVNSQAANAYGANSGGTAIGFGFETNTRANAAGQTDELVRWLLGGTGGAGKYQSNIAQAFYNASFVAYNPLSLEPAANSFLYGDVALATLDTPAANVPTWALLFSQLSAPASINAAGTGYNVGLVGYGNNGTGQTGSASIDYRRRAADNVLGALTDLQTFEGFLFGGAPNGLTQNLYFLDFDDPRRALGTASPFDFNAFRDNARFKADGTTPSEGITASGDSGGPLILQNFSQQVVIGVLSGGYTRFFNGQPANSYGTVSFYQPLYLYWDWIAANNPYHYVGSVAGNGNWTDPTHWVTTLDPAYMVLSGNTLVNGIPTVAGEQKNGTSGDFGQICFQSGGSSDCLDTKTGVETYDPTGHPIGTASDDPAVANVSNGVATGGSLGDLVYNIEKQDGSESSLGQSTLALPTATLTNGLPGATNFVPNNSDPVRATSTAGRYFDVTLAATGTTTLNTAVTIDRLTLGTGGATLQIDSAGSLTSLINVLEFAGTMNVNGTLTSVGDYSLFGGVVTGSGRINAPFLTSVLGQFAPGTASTIGTLTIGGNLVLGTGSQYFVNLGQNGTSDKIAVVANGTSTGLANLGGAVVFSPVAGYMIRSEDTYTILTSAGGVSGTFSAPAAFSAILTPTFTYTANTVTVKVAAGTYASVVASTSPVQVAYAQLLDQNRAARYSLLSDIYGPLDLQNAATIRATLDALAPRTETLKNAVGSVLVDNMGRFYDERISGMATGSANGTVAMIGRPMSVVANATTPSNNVGPMGSMNLGSDAPVTTSATLPSDMSGYLAGGYLNGDSAPMPTALPALGRDSFDGYYIAAGVEKDFSPTASGGVGISYSNVKGITPNAQEVRGQLAQLTLYGKIVTPGKIGFDGQLSVGALKLGTSRAATIVGTTYTLTSDSQSFAFGAEVGMSRLFDIGKTIKFGPRAAVRYSTVAYHDVSENGGPPALTIDRDGAKSIESRLGLELNGNGKIRPYLSGYWVHDFDTGNASVGANFVGGFGPNVPFAIAVKDKNWGEVSGGLSIDTGKFSIGVSADTTIARDDVSNQSYRGTIKFRF